MSVFTILRVSLYSQSAGVAGLSCEYLQYVSKIKLEEKSSSDFHNPHGRSTAFMSWVFNQSELQIKLTQMDCLIVPVLNEKIWL